MSRKDIWIMVLTGLRNCMFANWEKSHAVLDKTIQTFFSLLKEFIYSFDASLL